MRQTRLIRVDDSNHLDRQELKQMHRNDERRILLTL